MVVPSMEKKFPRFTSSWYLDKYPFYDWQDFLEREKSFFETKIYNFSGSKFLESASASVVRSLLSYNTFMYDTYFAGEDPVETEGMNDHVFDAHLWNKACNIAIGYQSYIRNNFYRDYKYYIDSNHNYLIKGMQADINEFMRVLDKCYTDNVFQDGSQMMDLATLESFGDQVYQDGVRTSLNIMDTEIKNKVYRISSKEGLEVPSIVMTFK